MQWNEGQNPGSPIAAVLRLSATHSHPLCLLVQDALENRENRADKTDQNGTAVSRQSILNSFLT